MTPSKSPLPLLDHAAAGVRDLRPYEPGMPVEELQRRLGVRDAVKLASNENPLGCSPRVRQALADAVAEHDLGRYPDGGGFRLRRRLAEFHDIEPERITLGNGSNEVLEFVARVFLAADRSAMYSQHCFAVYPIATRAQSAPAIEVPAFPADGAMPYGHDLEAFAAALNERVGVVFIANPNNPTGTWVAPPALEAFLQRVSPRTLVVLDEAYIDYFDPALRPDSRALLDRFPNLIVTRTFSKVYGLASLRAGYALSHPAVADLLNRVRQPFNMNALALLAAEHALDDQDHVARSVALNRQQLETVRGALRALGVGVLPSQTNFLTVDLGRNAAQAHRALLERGVIVRPMASYGLPNHLRLTIGTAAENRRLLHALEDVLQVTAAS